MPNVPATPIALGILGEAFASFVADTIVIDSEECGMRMRYVHCDERDTGGINLICEHRRHVLIDLEFNDQIHPVAHELVRIVQAVAPS